MNISKKLKVINRAGLHARAAAVLVETVSRFKSEIKLSLGDESINGKSIMGVMMLAATQGSLVEVSIEGNDAEACMESIEKLFLDFFGEDK